MNHTVSCYHCGEPVPAGVDIRARLGGEHQPMCCVGCKAVAEFIEASGLDAFYRYRENPDSDLGLRPEPGDWDRYDSEELLGRYVSERGGDAEATIEIGGMYCSACVWLLDKAMQQAPGVAEIKVNPATRRAVVRWDRDRLGFGALLERMAQVGFKPRPLAAGRVRTEGDDEYRQSLKRLLVAAVAGMQVMMFAVALYAGDFLGIEPGVEKFLRLISLLVCLPIVFYSARPFYAAAWRGLRARMPGMDLPVSLAITAAFVASAWAALTSRGEVYFDSVAMFVFFLSATRFLEMRARHRSDDYAQALSALLPDMATRIAAGAATRVPLDMVRAGDVLQIRSGDVVPVDGRLRSGSLAVDEAMLTGEPLPVQREPGDAVFAGTLVRGGGAQIKVVHCGAGTRLAEIGRLLERARADRPPLVQLADRIASRFVIAQLLVTAAAAGLWLMLDPGRAFEVALATLVVTCPCALALATPAAIAAATSRLAREGFLMVRSRTLDVLGHAATIVFDKTGTLTAGRPTVLKTEALAPDRMDARTCLETASALETASEHVLARAFGGHRADALMPESVRTTPGAGVEGVLDGTRYRVGSAGFAAGLCGEPEPPAAVEDSRTQAWLADESGLLARFAIGDALREGAAATIARLRSLGHTPVIASGDHPGAVREVAATLGIRAWHAGLSPAGKVRLIESLQQGGSRVVMVGDGINDAPVLAAADASIALDAGTALARASADALSLGRNLAVVATAAAISRSARRIIRQNLAWAIGYNATAIPLAVSGLLAPWMAALGMSASSLIVVLNALRLHGSLPRPGHAMPAPATAPVSQEISG